MFPLGIGYNIWGVRTIYVIPLNIEAPTYLLKNLITYLPTYLPTATYDRPLLDNILWKMYLVSAIFHLGRFSIPRDNYPASPIDIYNVPQLAPIQVSSLPPTLPVSLFSK